MNRQQRPKASGAAAIDRIHSREDLREFDGRLRWLAAFFFITLSVLAARLYSLQVVDGDHYFRLASNNFVREIELKPDRGSIFDAQGRALAENRPAYDVFASPRVLAANPDVVERLGEILHIAEADMARVRSRVAAAGRSDLLVRRSISRDQLATIETMRTDLPGVYIVVSQQRHYPHDDLAAHVVGFMNEISADELNRLREFGYQPGDHVGRTGLERAYEAVLRGAPGLQRQVVDVTGEVQSEEVNRQLLGEYRQVDAVPGRHLQLTLDIELQAIIEEAMAGAVSGGVVAIDPRDGAILGMFSKPGFNPNAWSGRLSEQEKRLSDNDPFHPMLDKSVMSWFPASTYKVVTAIAGLEEAVITADTTVHCPGHMDYGNRRFHCWNRSGHGEMDLVHALAQSCDIYFYQVGLQLGMDTLAQYAFEFGFGERPGLGFNGESPGVVPTREWHDAHSPGGFQYGFTVNTSVGQGDTRTSPLQLALAYAALSNGGRLFYPRLVDRLVTAEGDVIFEYPPRIRRELSFSPEHITQVVSGLDAVVNADFGTAFEQRLRYMHVLGKTGTAQVRSLESVRLVDGAIVHWDRDHAWFAAVAPADDPRIAVVVFIQHGGQGSSAAAPVAMRVIDRYFREVLGWDVEVELEQAGRSAGLLRTLLEQHPGRERLAELLRAAGEVTDPVALLSEVEL